MNEVPKTALERRYLRLAVRKEHLDKIIAELSSAFAVPLDKEKKNRYDADLNRDRAEREKIEKRMKVLEPLFQMDQARRHAAELALTDHGRALAAEGGLPVEAALGKIAQSARERDGVARKETRVRKGARITERTR